MEASSTQRGSKTLCWHLGIAGGELVAVCTEICQDFFYILYYSLTNISDFGGSDDHRSLFGRISPAHANLGLSPSLIGKHGHCLANLCKQDE